MIFSILADITGDGVLDLISRGFDPSNNFERLTVYDMSSLPFQNVTNSLLPNGLDATDIAAADFDNDLQMDLIIVDDDGDTLLSNNGNTLVDVTAGSGISNALGDSESVVVGDFDNDMDVDIYIVKDGVGTNAPNVLYDNQGDGTFVALPNANGAAGTSQGNADTVTVADYNRDGFLDLFTTNGEGPRSGPLGPSQLFQNQGNQNNWIQLSLEGTISNRDAIGARVFLTAGGVTQLREQSGGVHKFSQNSSRVHFGLGDNTIIDQIRIEWPSGIEQIFSDIPVNQILQIQELDQDLNRVSIAFNQNASEPDTDGEFIVSLTKFASSDTVVTYNIAGSATAGTDYTALQGTVTISAGSLSVPINVEVLDDSEEEGSESVVITLDSITSGDSDVVISSADSANVTIFDNDQSLSTVLVEAEDITNVATYRVENNSVASGGSMLTLIGAASNETGSASFGFTGVSGTYNVVLGTFDENDGAPAASLEVSVDGSSIGTVVLDQDPGGAGAAANTQVERSVATVSINPGDTITVTGLEVGEKLPASTLFVLIQWDRLHLKCRLWLLRMELNLM